MLLRTEYCNILIINPIHKSESRQKRNWQKRNQIPLFVANDRFLHMVFLGKVTNKKMLGLLPEISFLNLPTNDRLLYIDVLGQSNNYKNIGIASGDFVPQSPSQ